MKEFPGRYPCRAGHGATCDSITKLLAAKDYAGAAEEIIAATVLLNQGKTSIPITDFDRWINALPSAMQEIPELRFTRSWIFACKGNFPQALLLLDELFSFWHKQLNTDGDAIAREWLLYIKGAQGIMYEHMGSINKSQACFTMALNYLPEVLTGHHQLIFDIDSEEEKRLKKEDPSGFSTFLVQALRIYQVVGSHIEVARAAHNLGTQYLERGEADKARYWLERARDYRYTEGAEMPILFTLISLGQCYYQLGLLAEAQAALERCISIATRLDSVMLQSYALSTLADIYRDKEQYTTALDLYDKALSSASVIRDDRAIVEVLLSKGMLFLRQGDAVQSLTCATEAQSHSHGSRRMRLGAEMLIEIASRKATRGASIERLAKIVEDFAILGLNREVIIGSWYLADEYLMAGDEAKAHKMGKRSLELAQRCRQVYTLAQHLGECLSLARLSFDAGLCPEALAAMITHTPSSTLGPLLGEVPAARVAVAAVGRIREAAYVYIELLGDFRIRRGTVSLDLTATRSQKALLLLKYLCANKGVLSRREQIMDAVWPEAHSHSVEHSFEVAVSTLRKLLDTPGSPSAIVRKGRGYQLNEELSIRTDVEVFQHHLKQGQWWYKQGQQDLARAAWREAEGVYKGDFLGEDIYADWAQVERERLKEKYLDVMLALGELAFKQNEYDEAIERASYVVSHDSLREAAYRLLIKSYYKQGNRAKAIREYQRCEATLMAELSEEPMPETKSLLAKLKNNQY